MTTYDAVYKLSVMAPRSIDPDEETVLTPVAGAQHSDKFLVATRGSISDALGSYQPYLQPIAAGHRGRVDVRNKAAAIGVMYFEVVNPALVPGVPLTRWLEAFLGTLDGQIRAGGLRARAWESLDNGATFTAFWTGRLYTLEQVDSPAKYRLGVRESGDDLKALAWVGRPHSSIAYVGFATLLPIAATTVPYGLLPVVRPLTGTISELTSPPDASVRVIVVDVNHVNRTDNIISQNLREQRTTARVRVKRLDTQAVGFFHYYAPNLPSEQNGLGTHHLHPRFIQIQELDTIDVGYMAFPPNDTAVETWIEPEYEASDATPLLVGDVHPVTLWKALLDGHFGYLWTPPEPLPPGVSYGDPHLAVPYHAAKFDELEADDRFPLVRFVVTAREPRGNWIQEHILRPANLAYYFDGDGVLNPIDLRRPTDVSAIPTITDDDLQLGAPKEWEYDRSRAITRVDAAYYTDDIQKVDDVYADTAFYPTVKGGALQEVRHPITILDLGSSDLGDEPFALDVAGFRAMPGESLNGQPRTDYLRARLDELAHDTALPFGVGAPTMPLSCKRGSAGDAQLGELRKISIRSVPDPATNKLGGTRVVRVESRHERQGFVQLSVMDLGLPTVAGVPTLGQPAQEVGNTTIGATTLVTLNAAGDPVEVHFAVTDTGVGTAPVEGDALWTPVPGLVRATGTLTFRPGTPGKRIWVRGRTFPDVRVNYELPSAWVAAGGTGRVDLATIAAPSSPAGSLQTARSFRVTWTNGSADFPTELLIATPTTDPRVVVTRLPAGSTQYDFPGDTGLLIQPSTTYRVGIRHSVGPEAVSAEVTVDVTTTAVEPTFPPIIIPPRLFGKEII